MLYIDPGAGVGFIRVNGDNSQSERICSWKKPKKPTSVVNINIFKGTIELMDGIKGREWVNQRERERSGPYRHLKLRRTGAYTVHYE
jgi:hypothetical protein